MKNIRIIVILVCLGYIGLQNSTAQSSNEQEKEVFKVQMIEVPDAVKETLKNYSGYKISKDVSYKLKSSKRKSSKRKSDRIYRFKIERKNLPYVLLVNAKGKVMGIESKEGR